MGPVAKRVKTLTTPTAQVALLATAIDILIAELREVKVTQAALESKGVIYRGSYQAAGDYVRGDLVTFRGSLWHANAATRDAPGDGRSWTLAAKGADR